MYNRRTIRLKEFDYSQIGYYYITICTLDRSKLFGRIIDNKMILNEYGIIAHTEWKRTADIRINVELDEFIIMPDHIHGIIIINNRRGVMPYALKNKTHTKSENGNDVNRAYGNTPLPFTDTWNNGNTPLRSPIQTIG